MKLDTIIAVKDIQKSAEWYQSLLGCKSEGLHIVTLLDDESEVILCLHKWGEHDHPTMKNSDIVPGNGLILYVRTHDLQKIRNNAQQMDHQVEQEIELNPNSQKKEFALRDPDGYYLIISEYHDYGR
ncbi:VOC family protein [Fulvivirga ligni]|uniref:VOC family protein n=1 Tax=Fulvivirga ligni TaxID=2904246 RepID=UPI001F16A294|nr:VOC family protein [Fulvivirga ligni]UII22272.1 VOC family protein [Fulvivirga ligni]